MSDDRLVSAVASALSLVRCLNKVSLKVDMEICSTVSLKSFSRFHSQRQAHASWVSFEGWTVDENSDHSTCSDMSLGGGLSLEVRRLAYILFAVLMIFCQLPPTPVDQIHESKVLALMG